MNSARIHSRRRLCDFFHPERSYRAVQPLFGSPLELAEVCDVPVRRLRRVPADPLEMSTNGRF
jgi:hypothetical protein